MYQGRRQKFLNILPGLLATATLGFTQAAAAQGAGATTVFSYPSGFAGATGLFNTVTAAASFSGNGMQVVNGTTGQHEAAAVWYKTQVNITAFTTQFTFQMPNTGGVQSIVGMTFCIQNSNATTNPSDQYGTHWGIQAGTDANVDGYGAYIPFGQHSIGNSVAIKFDLNSNGEKSYLVGSTPSDTGLYIDGGPSAGLMPEIDLNPVGINLNAGHLTTATLVYDGSLLTMTLLDTVTNAQFRTSWPINIPAVVGGNNAWIGFTAGEIPTDVISVQSWSFWQGYNPRLSTPTFSVAPGSYPAAQTVTIGAPSGATIYYTTNGQQPTTSSAIYTAPITVNSNEIVQAVAVQSGHTDSLVATANYQIAPSGTPLINFPSGFVNSSGLITLAGSTTMNGNAIRLTDTNPRGWEVGAAWYDAPVGVTSFTTNFTLLLTSGTEQGMTFCIQNQNPTSTDSTSQYVSGGPYALGNQSGFGYSGTTGTGGQNAGLNTSVAVVFDLADGNLTGLYTNGANPYGSSIDMTSAGINLQSGHPLNVALSYNGTSLAMTVTDSVTKAVFSHSWTIDIPTTVAGNTAYVGFTGSTYWWWANQDIESWTYAQGGTPVAVAVPAAPTNLRVQ